MVNKNEKSLNQVDLSIVASKPSGVEFCLARAQLVG